MKKVLLFIIVFVILIPNKPKAQNTSETAALAVTAVAAIGAGIAAVEQMKEQAELKATEWLLVNHPEFKSFSLKTMDFDGKKLKDMSAVSVVTFKIQKIIPSEKMGIDSTKNVLFGFTSHGWINEYGINFDKIQWFLIDEYEWLNMMTAYVKVASGENNTQKVQETLKEGRVVNRGVKVKSKLRIPFYKITGDMYVVTDYSTDMKLVYNEKSLGIFLKESEDLVQLSRKSLIEIHNFFYHPELIN